MTNEKEIIELILNTDKLSNEHKKEIILEIVKKQTYPSYYPWYIDTNKYPNTNDFYYGTGMDNVTQDNQKTNSGYFNAETNG